MMFHSCDSLKIKVHVPQNLENSPKKFSVKKDFEVEKIKHLNV